MISVLLVDDDLAIRRSFTSLVELEDDMRVVGSVNDGGSALRLIPSVQPDVVVMDIRMPGMNGIEATTLIRRLATPPAVLAVTTFDLDEYVLGVLRAGASGFLVKHQAPEVLVGAIRVLADGGGIVSPRATRLLLQQLTPDPAGDAGGSLLTARELEIVRLVTKGHTNDDIAAELSISVPTVKSHIRSILQKIHGSTRVHIVIWAYENNLR
jgi:DNA-binding NarL/FixJ family response regulator